VIAVAIDIGGTFTDLVGFDDRAKRFAEAKSLTTPADLVQGIVDCLRKSGLAVDAIDELIHGSTIAINTLIERKGAKTALVVTRGTRDIYIIGRGNRPEAYNLLFHKHQPLVPRRLTYEVAERALASGAVLEKLDRSGVEAVARDLASEGVEAVAVCFLHSYVNPSHERAAGEIIRAALPDAYISLSQDILREYREFERTSTTVVNAYIGPKVGGYVRTLKSSLSAIGFAGDLSIMRSNGGVMTPEVAQERPVAMMESGPVGGIIASARTGAKLGYKNIISFDMGGTTAKASLIRDGEPTMAPGYYVGGYASGHAVMVPMIDVVEVGAGGGSIAWRDDIGALKVGPQSAGADPGPICYRGGGKEPTITDANVVLGRLDPHNFLGGTMVLDADGAARGIEKIAKPLGMSTTKGAQAILAIAINKMSLAVREVCRCFPRTSPRSACCSPMSAMTSSARFIPTLQAWTLMPFLPRTMRWLHRREPVCATAKGASSRCISISAISGRSSRFRFQCQWRSLGKATAPGSAPRSTGSMSIVTRIIRPMNPLRW
jgi:N-methylhydantoinase A